MKLFKENYQKLCGRKILKEQPIAYDNYLLFTLIIGTSKYGLNNDWIRSVISLRDTTNNPEKLITISFLNLLNENYLTTDGISSLILSALLSINEGRVNSAIVKNAHKANESICQFLGKDLFLCSIYLSSEHYIIAVSIGDEAIALRKFESIFLRRIRQLQNVLYFLTVAFLILTWLFLIKRYPQVKELANDIGVLLQLIGIGLFAFFLNKMKSKFADLLKLFFGHKN